MIEVELKRTTFGIIKSSSVSSAGVLRIASLLAI